MPSPEEAGPPVEALVVYNCNPAAVAPDQAAVIAGLQRDDLFTVVLEHFVTDTADYADYVLPATTQLEHWDIVRPYGHYFLPLNRPAIAPVGESLPNSEIFRRLAAALGYDDACFQEDDATILRNLVDAQTHPSFAGVTWEALLRDGYARLNLPQPYALRHGRLPHAQRQVRVLQRAHGRGRLRPAARVHAACVDGNAHAGAQRRGRAPDAAGLHLAAGPLVPQQQLRERAPLHPARGAPCVHIHPDDARRQVEDGARSPWPTNWARSNSRPR
ncbi:MAG: molybdopterin-dependent oxidoreductase [Caldilineaceae bacterium]